MRAPFHRGLMSLVLLEAAGAAVAGLTLEKAYNFSPNDLAYAPVKGELYASVRITSPRITNLVLAVDPVSGFTNWSLGLAGTPTTLAVSADEARLYVAVGYASSNTVARVNLASHQIEKEFPMPRSGTAYLQAVQILSLPGQPLSVVVLQNRSGLPYRTSIFDDGVERPKAGGALRFAVVQEDAGALWARSSDEQLVKYTIAADGFASAAAPTLRVTQAFAIEGEQLITGAGDVVELRTGAVVGKLVGSSGRIAGASVALFPETRRAWILDASLGVPSLRAFDLDSFCLMSTVRISSAGSTTGRMVAMGTNGFAVFSTSFFGQPPAIRVRPASMPSSDSADLAISLTESADPLPPGEDLVYTMVVANRGPVAADNLRITNAIPTGAQVLGVDSTEGTFRIKSNLVLCELPGLAAGHEARWRVRVKPGLGSAVAIASASATADQDDPDESNNSTWEATRVGVPEGVERIAQAPAFSTSVTWLPGQEKFLFTASGGRGWEGNRLHVVSARTTQREASWYVGSEPIAAAVTPDGAYAYVVLDYVTTNVARLNLSNGAVDLRFPAGGRVYGLRPLPDQPDAILVQTADGMAVYDRGLARPRTVSGQSFKEAFWFGAPTNVYALLNDGRLLEAVVTAEGVTLAGRFSPPVDYVFGTLDCSAGKAYLACGQVYDLATLAPDLSLPFRGALLADAARGRVYFGADGPGRACDVISVDAASGVATAMLSVPEVDVGQPDSLLATDQGVALSTGSQIILVDSAFFRASQRADLEATLQLPPPPLLTREEFAAVLVVTNHGPDIAIGAVVELDLPEDLRFVGASSTNVSLDLSLRTLRWLAGDLPAAAGTNLELSLSLAAAGDSWLRVRLGASSSDLSPGNNRLAIPLLAEWRSRPDTSQILRLTVRGLAWDSERQRLLATVASSRPGQTNYLVQIDPWTGHRTTVAGLGPWPGKVQVSRGGKFAYVLDQDATAMRRIDLENPSSDQSLIFALGFAANDFLILPEQPRSILVADNNWVWIYDDATARPSAAQGQCALAASADGQMIFGLGAYLDRLVAGPSGPEIVKRFYCGGLGSLFIDGGMVITRDGRMYDPEDGRWRRSLGNLAWNSEYLPELSAGRFYLISMTGVEVFDAETSRTVGSILLEEPPQAPARLLRWGADGLALCTAKGLAVIRSGLVPQGPTADLKLKLEEVARQPAGVGEEAEYLCRAFNAGPGSAAGSFVRLELPASAKLVSVEMQIGQWSTNANRLEWEMGELAAGTNLWLKARLRLPPGAHSLAGRLDAQVRDANSHDNWSALVTAVHLPYWLDQAELLPVPANDMVYDAVARRLYVAASHSATPGLADSLVTVDPATGRVGDPLYLGSEPNKLALSDDGGYLYIALSPSGRVRRLDLKSGAFDYDFLLPDTHHTVADMAVVAGRPELVGITLNDYTVSPSDKGMLLANSGAVMWNMLGPMTVAFVEPMQGRFAAYGAAGLVGVNLDWNCSGVALGESLGGPLEGWFDIKCGRGLVFLYSGRVANPTAHRIVAVHEDRTWGSIVEADPVEDAYYYLQNGGLYSYRLSNHSAISSVAVVNGAVAPAGGLQRWGADGFGFFSPVGVHLFRSSLVPLTPGKDTDGDGLPDTWESANNLNPNVDDGALDPDDDGLTNLQEYAGGTDPWLGPAGLKVEIARETSGAVILRMPLTPRSQAVVQYAETIHGPVWLDWPVAPAPASHPAWVVVSLLPDTTARFFRVRWVR